MHPDSILHAGDKVTYINNNKIEHGIVKYVPLNYPGYVFVVFNCGNQWHDYENYTAASTPISKLEHDWINDTVGYTNKDNQVKYNDSYEPISILPFLLLNSNI
jgi:hypothetical protein